MLQAGTDAIYLPKPDLLCDTRANTYVLKGKAEKKPISEVLQELFASLDIPHAKGESAPADEADDLGDIPAGTDFANPDADAKEPVADAQDPLAID
jgi:nascent polypeptide-associated complex subunit beta